MLRSLRTRLALSHTLPVLVFVALLGAALLYQLERYYFIDNLASELAAQGTIIASFTREQPQLLRNSELAQFALNRLHEEIPAQMMLVDGSGRVIAAVWFENIQQTIATADSAVVQSALRGKASWEITYSSALQTRMLEVAVPITRPPAEVIGAVRLSHSLDEIRRRLAPIRSLIYITLGVGAGLSLLLGLALGQSVSAPLRRLADVVSDYTPTTPHEPVPEAGPSEVRTLAGVFNRLGARLHELESTRQALLTGIVHELGRPLGAIKAAAQTIRSSRDADLAVELAAGIDDQVDQLRLQVEDLALLGEISLQGPQLTFAPVDIGDVVENQCRQFHALAEDRGIDLDCTIPPDLPLVQADAKRVTQIVDNLIHNALKYTSAGDRVAVTAAAAPPDAPSGVDITVRDNGPGIAPGEQESIFQLFYRSPAQQRLHQGMGIGLALARNLAQRHGGELRVESREGEGATFTLHLPVDGPAEAPRDSQAHDAANDVGESTDPGEASNARA